MGRECKPNKLSAEDINNIISSYPTVFTNRTETNTFRELAANIEFPHNKVIVGRATPNDFGTSTTSYDGASPKQQMIDYLYNYQSQYINNTAKLNRDLPLINWETTNGFNQGLNLNHYNRA